MFPAYPYKFGPYTVEGPVHPFHAGTVFRAYDYVTDQGPHRVALKLLPIATQDVRREMLINAFFKNADALSQVQHPQLCQVLDFGSHEGKAYLAMEWIDAPTLNSQIKAGTPWDVKAALELVRQLTLPLAELHRVHIVHRDLKPDNILLVPGRGPVVVGLGSAQARAPSMGSETGSQTGSTPLYLSSEQVCGGALEPTSDVFSLGVLLYQLLAGRLPFEGGTPAEVMHQIQEVSPMPPSCWNRRVPACVDAFLWHVLAKEPGQRVPSMEILRQGLDLCLKQLDLLGQPSGSQVSLPDFTSQLERSMANTPRQAEKPVQFTNEGGIAPTKAAGPADVFGSVAPVARQPAPSIPSKSVEPEWLRQRKQAQKQSQQIVAQMQDEDRRRRTEQDRQAQARRQEEIGRASFDELRAWTIANPSEMAVRKAYLSRRTPDQLGLDRGEVGGPAKKSRAMKGFFLGGLLGLVMGLFIAAVVWCSGPWGWASGGAAGGLFLGFFGGAGGGSKGAAGAGTVGAGAGATGGFLGSLLPPLLIFVCIPGVLALVLAGLGAWLSGSTAAKDWGDLGPLPPSAFRLSLDEARKLYLGG